MDRIIKRFKGGSLSSTNLIESRGRLLVRKSVSLVENREYGFQRWYSQMKKMQRYSIMFPGLFPNVLEYGIDDKTAYFDMEFFKNAVNAQEYIQNSNSRSDIKIFFNLLILEIDRLHESKIKSSKNPIGLYIHEEVEQRLKDCYSSSFFMDFLKNKTIVFNGVRVDSFINSLDQYKSMVDKYYNESVETFTHGNMTLENILYIPHQHRIIFIMLQV